MADYTHGELTEALQAINSFIHKCEKAQEKFPEGNTHHTLLKIRLKALFISKTLITEALSKKPQPTVCHNSKPELLLLHLDKLHTTDMGSGRIKRNLQLDADDVVGWCRKKIQNNNSDITRKGKNWYIVVDGCEITVNAYSYTIITAHKKTKKQEGVY